MKVLSFVALVGAVALAACGGGGEGGGEDASLKRACMKMEADVEATEYVSGAGVEFDAFCDCLSARIEALPEADRKEASAALLAVTGQMDADNTRTDDIVRSIRDAGEAEDASEEAIALAGSVDELGDFITETRNALADGGACPA